MRVLSRETALPETVAQILKGAESGTETFRSDAVPSVHPLGKDDGQTFFELQLSELAGHDPSLAEDPATVAMSGAVLPVPAITADRTSRQLGVVTNALDAIPNHGFNNPTGHIARRGAADASSSIVVMPETEDDRALTAWLSSIGSRVPDVGAGTNSKMPQDFMEQVATNDKFLAGVEVVSVKTASFHDFHQRVAAPAGALPSAPGDVDFLAGKVQEALGPRDRTQHPGRRIGLSLQTELASAVAETSPVGNASREDVKPSSVVTSQNQSAPAGETAITDGGSDLSLLVPQTLTAQITAGFRSAMREAATINQSGFVWQEPATFAQQPIRTLDLVLQPDDLGRVTIKMKLTGSGLSVALSAEKQATRELLEVEMDGLRDQLAASGFDLDTVTLQPGSTIVQAASADVSARERASNQPDGQQGRFGNGAGFAGNGNWNDRDNRPSNESASERRTTGMTDRGEDDDRVGLYV